VKLGASALLELSVHEITPSPEKLDAFYLRRTPQHDSRLNVLSQSEQFVIR
jgi:hypothetical protein